MITRRQFMKLSAAAGASLLAPFGWLGRTGSKVLAADSPNLTKFLDPLPIPPVLKEATSYTIEMRPGKHQFHTQLPVTASRDTTWGYAVGDTFLGYLGPTIEAHKGTPISVTWINNLPTDPAQFPLATSVDPTVPNPEFYPGLKPGRAVPHLHGGFTPPKFDGHPQSWFTKDGDTGPTYFTNKFTYSNAQNACMLWYHDHAMGITRLNVYAGLAAFYLLRDEHDTGVSGTGLNLPAGKYEVPLAIQDKQFNPDGSLFYPTVGVTAIHPIWVPEFFGDTPVINGVAYPYLNVEPRRYRLRLLNGSQARFYNLWFDNGQGPVPFWLIGMEQGLLPNAPVMMDKILLAPAERADIIIDFTGMAPGTLLTLNNNAKTPFPGGGGMPGGARLPLLMQFRVIAPLPDSPPDTTTPPAQLVLPPINRLATSGDPLTGIPQGMVAREIALKETEDELTGAPIEVRLNQRFFFEPVEETPQVGATEVWQFINLTVDAHPMHVHLVQFQVVNRQPFNVPSYTTDYLNWVAEGRDPATKPVLKNYITGPAAPPTPEEMGWKDTAKAYPGQILRIAAKFDLPPHVNPPAPYVYHCHILEHEENEMMRPFEVRRAVTKTTVGTNGAQASSDIAPTFVPPK